MLSALSFLVMRCREGGRRLFANTAYCSCTMHEGGSQESWMANCSYVERCRREVHDARHVDVKYGWV